MSLLPPGVLGDKVALGNLAGYAVGFHKRNDDGTTNGRQELLLTSDDYDATIDASMPGGLGAGSYTITIEGVTDKDYKQIANQQDSEPDALRIVRLYLYWRDANASVGGYLASAVGVSSLLGAPSTDALDKALVAELCISSISRRVGPRRYDALIVARESAWAALDRSLFGPVAGTMSDGLTAISQQLGVPIVPHLDSLAAAGTGAAPGADHITVPRGTVGHVALAAVARRLEQASKSYGRGMYLIRNGRLHVGPRPIPLEGEPKTLDLGGGLVEVVELAPVSRDTEAGSGSTTPKPQPSRRQFRITLKGRPDVRPGDVVAFDPPPDDASTQPSLGAALLGPLAGPLTASMGGDPSATGYVSSVQHRYGRSTGFVTELTAVWLDPGDSGWDTRSAGPASSSATDGKPQDATAGPIDSLLGAIERVVARILDAAASPDVAEVRDHTTDAGTDPTTEPPTQSVTVWHGATGADGRGRGARRLDIDRSDPLEMPGVPYATPFAWGSCGLVLPRYPGTRVVTMPRNGDHDDRVDIGALWQNGTAPASKTGDWWLILPVGAPTSAPSGDTPPPTTVKQVTNDLVDANGNRCIDVGRLRVRVGPAGLPAAGDRPDPPKGAFVSIEHADGKTMLVIDDNGKVTIHAAGDLVLESEGNIEMTAKNVNVQVQTAMNVQ
jgi:hypothetical protein